jgi:hypothetical protein
MLLCFVSPAFAQVAKIGDTEYPTLKQAITAAAAGQTITMIDDAAESVTIGKNLTIDGAGKTLTGGITTSSSSYITVTVKNLVLDGNNMAVNYAVTVNKAQNFVIENCQANNFGYGFLYVNKSNNIVTVKNITIENCNYGVRAAAFNKLNLENFDTKNVKYPVQVKANATKTVNMTDCDILEVKDGGSALSTWEANSAVTFNFNGNNVFDEELPASAGIDYSDSKETNVTIAKNVAKIGDKGYKSLAEALAAIGAGDVVIELLEDATLNYGAREAYGTAETTSVTIKGNGKTLTLNQTNSDWSSFGLAAGKVVFNNMTIEKTGHGDTGGAWNTHAIIFSSPVEMTDVTVNQSMAVQAGATLNNVTINEANGFYGLWINGNGQAVTVNDGAINATNGGRGIKIADQYIAEPAQVKLNVDGTVFSTAKKAAVLVSSKAGAKIAAANVNIENVDEDPVNFVWIDEDWAAHYDKVEVTGAQVKHEGDFVAKLSDGTFHKTVAAAITAAPAGATITLIADVNEKVTISKNLTIDGAGKQYTGTMTANKGLTVTVENVNFVNAGFDKPSNQNSTTGIYNIKNCTFDGAGSYAYPIRMYGGNQINVEDCTVKNYLYSFLYVVKAALNVSVKNVTVENCPNYAIYFASGVTNANIEGLTVKNADNGLIINNTATRMLTIKDCKMESVDTAIKHTGGTSAINVTANGVNDFGTAVMSQYVKLNAAAQVGTKVCGTLADAVEAAQAGETVKLLSNVELSTFLTINKSITLDLGEYNITRADGTGLYVNGDVEVAINGTGKVSGAQALYVANGLVKVNCGNFVGNKEAVYVQNTGKVEIYGGTFEATNDDKRFVLNKYDSDRATTSITVYGGTFVGFNPANNAAEGKNTNFVAEGYASVDNGDGTYTVAEAATPVAEVGGKTYSSLIAAFSAAQDGETVTLVDNVALDTKTLTTQNDGYSVILNVNGKAITLDLNGKNITVDAAAADLASAKGGMLLAVFSADLNGDLTLTDNTEAKNGTVTVNLNDAKVYSVFVSESGQSDKSNSGKITVEAGNYATNGKVSNAMFFADADEVITVNGGNFYCDGATTTAAYPWMFNTYDNDVLSVIVSGGTFNVNVSKQYRSAEVQLVEGKIIKDNGDGTWTVVPGYDELTINHADWAGRDFVNENDIPVNTLNYVRNFSRTTWQAFYVPFAINYDDIKDDFDVARLNMAHQEEIDGKVQIKIDFISMKAGQTMKANYPYMIRPKQAGAYTFTVKNTTLKKAVSRSIDCSTVDVKFTFTGTYRTIFGDELVDNKYYYMGGGILGFTTNRTYKLNPFNWYMTMEGREDLSDVKFVFGGDFEDEETTGITNIDNDQKNDGNIYDLQGRRVLHPQKGSLYIVNGKKVVY